MIKTIEKYPDVNGKSKDVAVWKPSTGTVWPGLWFYPGLGAAGQSVQQINEGLDRFLDNGGNVPFIVFMTSDGNGWIDPEKEGRPLLNWILARPDVNGLSATGLSAGADAIYRFLKARFPLKSVVPISINSNDYTSCVNEMEGIPVWHFHGNRDSSPNAPNSSTGFIREYDAHFPGKAKRTVFQNLGHNSWDTVYQSRLSEPTLNGDPLLEQPFDQDIYSWMLKFHTEAPPDEIIPLDKMELVNGEIIAKFGDRKFKIDGVEIT